MQQEIEPTKSGIHGRYGFIINVEKFHKGAFYAIQWERQCKTKKSYKGNAIIKTVNGIFRFGLNYDNIKNVIAKRNNGELPEKNNGLPWGEWESFPYIIRHKGNKYIRFYTVPNGKVESSFKVDGKTVDKNSLNSILLASEKTTGKAIDCFTIKTANILTIERN